MLKNRKRSEKQFTQGIVRHLRRELGAVYEIGTGAKANLLYKLIIVPGITIKPEKWGKPARAQYAFQTDVLITRKRDHTPLVVIEIKFGGFSTHDVLTYSSKALKHKEIYPYLRYGFMVGDQKQLDWKFFTHNTGFDFALAIGSGYTSRQKDLLTAMIKNQIKIAKRLTEIVQKNRELVKSYETTIEFE